MCQKMRRSLVEFLMLKAESTFASCIQAVKMFFFHVHDPSSSFNFFYPIFINALIGLLGLLHTFCLRLIFLSAHVFWM